MNPEYDVDWDEDEERWIMKSRAFQNPTKPVKTDRMSIVLGDTLLSAGRAREDARRSKPTWYVVALTASFVRGEAQAVERSPSEAEEAHGDVVGEKNPTRISTPVQY